MNAPRRKEYDRKSTRLRPPADAAELRRIVWILGRANASGKLPGIVMHSPDDDPLRHHVAKLKRILAGHNAGEVFGQRAGSGRKPKTDSRDARGLVLPRTGI